MLNGLLIFLAIILVIMNYSRIKNLNFAKIITLLLLFSMSIGIHGLSHLGLEKLYDYDPLHIICQYGLN
jgi:predicted membrane protein